MAGSQIGTSVTIISSLLGYQAISLTNFATSAQSLIAAGSKVEIAGAFFNFPGNETPNASSWTAVGTGNTAYIAVIPAGTAGTQTVTAEYSDTAPTWITSKQGWYASAASLTRYVAGVTKTSPTQYDDAFIVHGEQELSAVNRWFPQDITINGLITGALYRTKYINETNIFPSSAYTIIRALLPSNSNLRCEGFIVTSSKTIIADTIHWSSSGGGSFDVTGINMVTAQTLQFAIVAGGEHMAYIRLCWG